MPNARHSTLALDMSGRPSHTVTNALSKTQANIERLKNTVSKKQNITTTLRDLGFEEDRETITDLNFFNYQIPGFLIPRWLRIDKHMKLYKSTERNQYVALVRPNKTGNPLGNASASQRYFSKKKSSIPIAIIPVDLKSFDMDPELLQHELIHLIQYEQLPWGIHVANVQKKRSRMNYRLGTIFSNLKLKIGSPKFRASMLLTEFQAYAEESDPISIGFRDSWRELVRLLNQDDPNWKDIELYLMYAQEHLPKKHYDVRGADVIAFALRWLKGEIEADRD
jgi:hypothetical protein